MDAYSETLRLNDCGALILHPTFIMLLYPSRQERWAFLKPMQPQSESLDFCILAPVDSPASDGLKSSVTLKAGESHVESVFRILFDFDNNDVGRLFEWPGRQLARKVFLLYDAEQHAAELDLMTRFLIAKGVKVYHTGQEGSWRYWKDRVIGDPKGGGGTVIVSPL